MAEVYRSIQGRPFEDWLAHTAMVHAGVGVHATQRYAIAKGIHAQHRLEGHSFVELEEGTVDWFVTLNDTRGLRAAMSIEYGRSASDPADPKGEGVGAWAGTQTLHRAFGMQTLRTFPRSRRKRKPITPKGR